jgi:hypothetical protein
MASQPDADNDSQRPSTVAAAPTGRPIDGGRPLPSFELLRGASATKPSPPMRIRALILALNRHNETALLLSPAGPDFNPNEATPHPRADQCPDFRYCFRLRVGERVSPPIAKRSEIWGNLLSFEDPGSTVEPNDRVMQEIPNSRSTTSKRVI